MPKAKRVFVGRLCPSFGTYFGTRANMVSDDASAVCLRPYDLHASMACQKGFFVASVEPRHAAGARVGEVAVRPGLGEIRVPAGGYVRLSLQRVAIGEVK